MKRTRDTNKRLKALGMPIELCIKFERLIGLKPGEKPNYVERIKISDAMITAMEAAVRNVRLTEDDYRLIADEVGRNRADRSGGTTTNETEREG